MTRIINLNSMQGAKERQRQVQSYGTQTPLSSTSVDRGQTHWMNGSTVTIDGILDVTGITQISGSLDVSGTTTISGSTTIAGPTGITGALTIAGSMDVTGPTTISGALGIDGDTTISGLLDVTGTTSLDGPTAITGLLDITGDTTVAGDLSIDGPLDVTGATTLGGATTLSNDLTLTAGGTIKAGNLEIEPASGGQINFLNGSITSSGFGLGIINTLGVQISSPNTKITDLPTTSVAVANLHIDSSGKLWRVV